MINFTSIFKQHTLTSVQYDSQDGKSNIWSIEPKMVVVDEDSEDDGEGGGPGLKNKNLVVGGIVIAAAVAALPLFTFFSKLVPDPSDF
jgi:hypothetical protein